MNKLITLLAGIFALSLVSAQQPYYNGCFGMMSGTYGFGYMAFGWIFMTLVAVALVLLIIWLVKQLTTSQNNRRRK